MSRPRSSITPSFTSSFASPEFNNEKNEDSYRLTIHRRQSICGMKIYLRVHDLSILHKIKSNRSYPSRSLPHNLTNVLHEYHPSIQTIQSSSYPYTLQDMNTANHASLSLTLSSSIKTSSSYGSNTSSSSIHSSNFVKDFLSLGYTPLQQKQIIHFYSNQQRRHNQDLKQYHDNVRIYKSLIHHSIKYISDHVNFFDWKPTNEATWYTQMNSYDSWVSPASRNQILLWHCEIRQKASKSDFRRKRQSSSSNAKSVNGKNPSSIPGTSSSIDGNEPNQTASHHLDQGEQISRIEKSPVIVKARGIVNAHPSQVLDMFLDNEKWMEFDQSCIDIQDLYKYPSPASKNDSISKHKTNNNKDNSVCSSSPSKKCDNNDEREDDDENDDETDSPSSSGNNLSSSCTATSSHNTCFTGLSGITSCGLGSSLYSKVIRLTRHQSVEGGTKPYRFDILLHAREIVDFTVNDLYQYYYDCGDGSGGRKGSLSNKLKLMTGNKVPEKIPENERPITGYIIVCREVLIDDGNDTQDLRDKSTRCEMLLWAILIRFYDESENQHHQGKNSILLEDDDDVDDITAAESSRSKGAAGGGLVKTEVTTVTQMYCPNEPYKQMMRSMIRPNEARNLIRDLQDYFDFRGR